jgi:hypothetical protein
MMALLVGANATTAEAISFSYTFGGCEGDSICVVPVISGAPDSIVWQLCGTPPTTKAKDLSAPWDTCFNSTSIFRWDLSGRADSVCMHAWYAAVDSLVIRRIDANKMVAMSDGVTVPENGTIGINVRMNDTTSTPDSAWLQVWTGDVLPPLQEDGTITNGPNHGTIDSIVNNTTIWYTPAPGYNGTDDFVYRSTNECGTTDTALVAITITSNGFLSFDSCAYDWVDVPCACDDSAQGLGTISVGDSIRVRAYISAWDLDELTANWPKVDLPGLAGSSLTMVRDTSAALGMLDTTRFAWPGRVIDSASTWFEVTPGNLDVAAGFYSIISRARSTVAPNHISACTTLVKEAIDNKTPDIGSGAATWTLYHDVNGDGIATTVDSMRFFVDLRNEPFEEICKVCVTTYGFPYETDTSSAGGYNACLYEIAGDNRWGLVFKVPPGDLENGDGPFHAVIRYTDNACNTDSVEVTYNGPVDNSAPICANVVTHFRELTDLDSNNCISLGEQVRFEFTDTNSINNDVTYWLDLLSNDSLRFGLGVADSTNLYQDSVPLNNLGGGLWRLDWTLGKYPLANAVDTSAVAGNHPWAYLHGVDDAGNPFTCDSLPIYWDDPNPNICCLDARPPNPVVLDSCVAATTFLGTRAVHIYFHDTTDGPGMQDIARFRMFYDNGTGVINYTDTLAGLNWSDSVGGGGTNGLHHVGGENWYWTTDGTVELSWCRDYTFNIWVIDSCGNLESTHPDSIFCEGENPDPVTYLDCSSGDSANICLEWKTVETSADSFRVYMSTDGVYDTAHWVASVDFTDTGKVYTWCTADAGLTLQENREYDFIVYTFDSCGNRQVDSATSVNQSFVSRCRGDVAPPLACVFQPAPGDTMSCERCAFLDGSAPSGFYIYVKADLPGSNDIQGIDSVVARLLDDGSGSPGPWVRLSTSWGFQTGSDNLIAIWINSCAQLDSLVGAGGVKDLELVVVATDDVGKAMTVDDIYAACGGWKFGWANTGATLDLTVDEVNSKVELYQDYCQVDGFSVWGPVNTVHLCITGGLPPYKLRMEAAPSTEPYATTENQVVYVENVYAACTTLTFSAAGFQKGEGEIDVFACDASGSYTGEREYKFCVPDTIPPCALIANPVDGKCIRRSRSSLDPVNICVIINPLQNCLDPDEIVKIDYQWSEQCCTGTIQDTLRVCDTTHGPGGGSSVCDTFPTHATGDNIDSVVCVDTGFGGFIIRCHDTLVELPCESQFQWHTFAINSGDSIKGPTDCAQWYNAQDLAWVTQSGTPVFLRAILYDDQGNKYTTPCVQTCVDIDTPPLCLQTPDICYSNGEEAIGGGEFRDSTLQPGSPEVTFYATLDMSQGNTDDLEDVHLWWKKSTDPDQFEYWYDFGSGFLDANANVGGTNSTVWRWDVPVNMFSSNIHYDFRAEAKTIYGMWSYDLNGDGRFDASTYDSSKCDMNTYLIDNIAPQVSVDSVWTDVNGQTVVQPNVSCTMSDPRGWVWGQFGQNFTVQPNVFPWYDVNNQPLRDDIKRVQWTLWDDQAECHCTEGFGGLPSRSSFNSEPKGLDGAQSWVIAINEGGNPLRNVTFNPANAPWFLNQPAPNGYSTVVLQVQVWDSCGNMTEDCVTMYLLDITPTDAILVEPHNDDVFCTAPGGEAQGGITLRAAAILENGWNKVIYAYRAVGSSTWIDFDSVGISADPDHAGWQHSWTSVNWDPVALGLPDGSYELTVWAVDNALNRSPNNYPITVHLSCAPPTVQVIYPTSDSPRFIGCPLDLEAIATSPDPKNPIVEVEFHAVPITESIGDPQDIDIGSDFYSVDNHWGVHWDNPTIEGRYYIYANAWNKAGKMVRSELVAVMGDDTDPEAHVAQVSNDLSDGGSTDPTVIQAGQTVDIWGYARDVDGGWGAGAVDNCGVDSVLFFVKDGYDKLDGFFMTPSNTIDSLYHGTWNTTGYAAGTYRVKMQVFDCACNSSWSDSWWVKIVGPTQVPTIAMSDPEDFVIVCDTVSVDGVAPIVVTLPNPTYVSEVEVWASNAKFSDVEDRYSQFEGTQGSDGNWYFNINTAGWDEGTYRFRAVIFYTDGTVSEDGSDGDSNPDDFTFNPSLHPYHMWVRVDHSVTPFTVTTENGYTTFKAHEDICLNVDAEQGCDIDHLHVGVGGIPYDTTFGNNFDSLRFCFDPLDSSKVTLSNCNSWNGDIQVTADDHFEHSEAVLVNVWILDVGTDSVAITGPAWSDYLTPTSNTISARKLSSSTVDSVQFFASTSQTNGTITYIGSSVATGDAFSTKWSVENVTEGQYWLYGKAFHSGIGLDGPRCPATVAKGCVPFGLTPPNPSYTRTVNGLPFVFVGEHTDLCVSRDSVSSLAAVGIDSIAWFFRNADVPGVTIDGNLDPNLGWVEIGSDKYGSLCTDWFTDWCKVINDLDLNGYYNYGGESGRVCCPDGRYTVVARVYDKAGNQCHSKPMNIMIDDSDPYTEINDINGDETFGSCHEVVLPQDTTVVFKATAIDDHSCANKEPYQAWNSGTKYLQFYVGECGATGGCADIVFVQDGSGSMSDDQQAIATNAQLFAEGLGSSDIRLGVLGFVNEYKVVGTDGSLIDAAPGNGQFTTDLATFQTMITSVGDDLIGDGGTENGLTAMNEALEAYPWRQNCLKVLILVTDEHANDVANYSTLFPPIVTSKAAVFGVINYGDSAGYSQLGAKTGGDLYDIFANWGANLAALSGRISGLASAHANDVGIIWGQTVALTDGQDNAFAIWNPSGLEPGSYCAWTVAIDNVGNRLVSSSREICIVDKTAPVASISGFGKSTDEHMVNKYKIYGRTWDTDVDHVQFQYRQTGSTSETAWTGIGISSKINGDSTCWETSWNPCVLSGSYDLRVVATDKSGNEDFDLAPIATVTITTENGVCGIITPSGPSADLATNIWFEDRRFADLGLVHVDQSPAGSAFNNMMQAVWADMTGDLRVEKIELWTPDPDQPTWKSGSFTGSTAILTGGTGWFWNSWDEPKSGANPPRTHLKREDVTVWPIKAAVGGCNSIHNSLGAKVCVDPGALSADNGIVVFPARVPTVGLDQQHYWAVPAIQGTRFPLVTSIRLTNEQEGFNIGQYAKVTLKYDQAYAAANNLNASDMTVAWWDGDEWNTNDGLIAAGTIGNGSAVVNTMNLHGLYAVVTGTRPCNTGALIVENAGAEVHSGNILPPMPEIYTKVKSKIEGQNSNKDVNPYAITVVLDGSTTIYSNGDNPNDHTYRSEWDEVTGILTTRWRGDAPPLAQGTHTLYVQAFSKSGYCQENTYTFLVDATPPNIVVTGNRVCANPTFNVQITDAGGAGVDWPHVFVDVFDITGSDVTLTPKDKLIHTESYDAFNENLDPNTGKFSFQLVDQIAQGRRLRIVIYNGNRYEAVSEQCGCVTFLYDHPEDGVNDLVNNYTQVVEEDYTVWGPCGDTAGGGVVVIDPGAGSRNPFDPWAGDVIRFNLNGFDGGGRVTATVYDLAGEKVATIYNGTASGTVSSATWAGKTDGGDYVAEGVYLVHFQNEGAQVSGPSSQVLKVVVKRGAGGVSSTQ